MRWKAIRIFISSTFLDMEAERDYLVKRVFPELRARLNTRFVHVIDIDLRWGLPPTSDFAATVSSCLQRIDDCRPFFLAMLGERYGSIVEEGPLNGRSITEIEIDYHAAGPRGWTTGLFYLRDPAFLADVPPESRDVYCEAAGSSKGKTQSEKIATLKDLVRSRKHEAFVFDGYPCRWDGKSGRVAGLKPFGDSVVAELERVILAVLGQEHGPEPENFDGLGDEDGLQLDHVERESFSYVPRPVLERRIAAEVAAAAGPLLCLVGPQGSGKSVQLSHWLREQAGRKDVLWNFAGLSAASRDVEAVLERFCRRLSFTLGRRDIDGTVGRLSERFADLLAERARASPVIVVLDAIEHMHNASGDSGLSWLPDPIPEGATFLLSLDPDDQSARSIFELLRQRDVRLVAIGDLDEGDQMSFAEAVIRQAGKQIDLESLPALFGHSVARRPRTLCAVVEEMRLFGSLDDVRGFVDGLPSGEGATAAFFGHYLDRLCDDYGPHLVTCLLSLLACSRNGLRESELASILGKHGQGDEEDDMYLVLRRMRAHLTWWGDRISLPAGPLREAARRAFMPLPASEAVVNQLIANEFQASRDPRRRLVDVLTHLAAAGPMSSGRMREVIGAPDFLAASAAFDFRAVAAAVVEWQERTGERLRDLYSDGASTGHAFHQAQAHILARLFGQLGEHDLHAKLLKLVTAPDDCELLLERGNVALDQGEIGAALKLFAQCEAAAGDPTLRAKAIGARGTALLRSDRAEEALAAYRCAEALHRELGDLTAVGVALINIGSAYNDLGRFDEALISYRNAEKLLDDGRDANSLATCLYNQADHHFRSGAHKLALANLDRADTVDGRGGSQHGRSRNARLRASVMGKANTELRLQLSVEQLEKARAIREPLTLIHASVSHALALQAADRYSEAISQAEAAAELSREHGFGAEQREADGLLASLLLLTGRTAEAEALFGKMTARIGREKT